MLGARSELRLRRLERQLRERGVPHVAFRETDQPYQGQLMAVALLPGPRVLGALLHEFALLK